MRPCITPLSCPRCVDDVTDTRAGDRVMLRDPEEILATLDERGSLEGVPFMPEMLGFFGSEFTVAAQVDRACDTVNYTGVLRLRNTVILDDLRCDGTGHAGCGAQCRLYWKEAWLRPASAGVKRDDRPNEEALARLRHLVEGSVQGADSTPEQPTFRCQATELIRAGEKVGWYRFTSELTGGNVGLWRFVRVTAGVVVQEIGRRLGLRKNDPFRPGELKGQNFVAPAPRGLRPGQ